LVRHGMVVLALTLATSLAVAQAAKPFIGKWSVEWQTDKQTYGAEMEITETGGSWQTATSSRANPCFGRKVPIQHDSATANSLDMTLKFSEIIPDCKNATVKLQLDDKGAVVGKRSGYELKLKRD
jgi:hypothetical protein